MGGGAPSAPLSEVSVQSKMKLMVGGSPATMVQLCWFVLE